MAGWFDKHAKASAAAAQAETGLSRRQLIQGGAVVAGAAWVAPSLLTATPAWAGASICTSSSPVYSLCPDNLTYLCCPTGQECLLNTRGQQVCDVPVGGVCSNSGNGQCDGGFSRCNHLSAVSICGGPGAYCDFLNNAVCIPTSPCYPAVGTTNARCGGPGAPCTSDSDCASGSTGHLDDTFCVSGVCTCPSGSTCI